MQFSEITKGTPDNVENTLEMFFSITDVLLAHGVDQWNYDYPDLETLTNDVVLGHNFVIRSENKIAASMVLNEKQDDQYKFVHWPQRSKKVLVIHRLGVHPEFQGHGLGKKMCLFAEEYAKEHGYNSIRLDAYAGNQISNAMYLKLGYTRANGYCFFRKKAIPFYCYEKAMKIV
ncbi:MAG: GNAT family N-acetyltransferase [Saprospiraceae bacterium]|nr:GNAT family N-acetyltransferase [Saprospiraceae bacterium]